MHYTALRQDGSVIADFRHGCWGMLAAGSMRSRGSGVDGIIWEIDQWEGINTFKKVYGCTDEEFFGTMLKGYTFELTKSSSRTPVVTHVKITGLWDKNPQETMLRLFGLRTCVYMYNKKPMVQLCKDHGMSLTAAVVITNAFAPVVKNTLGVKSEVTSIQPQLDNGGNIGYYNTTISDFRRFMKGEFKANKKLIENDTTWGEARGYTSGSTGRFVQEACSHAPMGSALLGGYFYPGAEDMDRHLYETSFYDRSRKQVRSIIGSKWNMPIKEFFDLMKAIVNKKKLPVQRGLPHYKANNLNIPRTLRESVNPFLKHVDL